MPLNVYEEWDLPKGRFVFTKQLSEGALLFKQQSTDRDVVVSGEEFERLHARGEAVRVHRGRGRNSRYDEQDDVPPEGATDEEKVRRFYCRKWDEAPCAKSDVALKRLVTYHAPEAKRLGLSWQPSPGAIRRAINSRGEMGRRPLRVMQSLRGKTTRQHWPAAVVEAIRRVTLWYYAHRQRSKGDAYNYLVKFMLKLNGLGRVRHGSAWRTLPTPSEETVRTRINAGKTLTNLTAKFSEMEARRQMKGTVPALKAEAIFDYVLIDSTIIDGWCVLDDRHGLLIPAGRPTLTVAMDLYSRTILAVVLTYEPPSLYTIMSCLQRITVKKLDLMEEYPDFVELWEEKWGLPEVVLVDNEWAQTGVALQDACADASISLEWAPVKNPEYKAYIERFFDTLNRKLFHRMPGAVPFPAHLMRKLDLDPAKDAVIARSDLEGLIYQTLRDSYQYEIHSGTGFAPETLWRAGMEKGRQVIDDANFLASMFGAVKEATLTRSGIRFKGMQFHHPATTSALLNDLAGTSPIRTQRKGSATVKVKIKHNPADASKIEVWNSQMKPRKRYVALPNQDEAYVAGGLGFWHHKMVKAFAKAEELAFGTDAERTIARDRLRVAVENASPDMKMAAMRTFRRLKDPAKPVLRGDVVNHKRRRPGVLAIRDSDIPVVPAAEERVDDGVPVKGPRRGGAKAAKKGRETKARNAASKERELQGKSEMPALPSPVATGSGPAVSDQDAYYADLLKRMADANKST